jgi:hypothetical protein
VIRAPRFSIRTLLIGMTYAAVVMLAFMSGASLWSDIVYSCTIFTLFVATLAALFLNNGRRTFWQGYCIIGWVYIFLGFIPSTENSLRDHLVTQQALALVQRVVAPIHAARQVEPGYELLKANENAYRIGRTSFFLVFDEESWRATKHTGHSVWALLLGWLGGHLAMYFSNQNKVEPTNRGTPLNIT